MGLDHAPEQIVRQLLVDLGLATDPKLTQDWPAYFGGMPDEEPSNLVVVYGTSGRNDGFSQVGERDEMPGIQITVRASQQSTGYAKADAIASALDDVEMAAVDIGSTHYRVHAVVRTSEVLSIGREPGSKRRVFNVNAVVPLEQL